MSSYILSWPATAHYRVCRVRMWTQTTAELSPDGQSQPAPRPAARLGLLPIFLHQPIGLDLDFAGLEKGRGRGSKRPLGWSCLPVALVSCFGLRLSGAPPLRRPPFHRGQKITEGTV